VRLLITAGSTCPPRLNTVSPGRNIVAAVKARRAIHRPPPRPWGPDESRIVIRFAQRLLAGRYPGLAPAAAECLRALRTRQAARPASAPPGRAYRRTFDAVRSRLSAVTIARGRPKAHKLWDPAERRLAYKWIRRYLRHQEDVFPLALLDAARGLLVDLLEHGYERTLAACENELLKCRVDAARGRTRHAGRIGAETRLPASLLRGARPQPERTKPSA
jgi:hypothetical protein